ncbi:MAG TPA: SDR family oxidoreductase [Pseudonocardiaceae bacterium]
MTTEAGRGDHAAGVLVVTGGGRGIGAATAVLAAARGWSVCVGYRTDAEAAARVVDDCRRHGVDAVAERADVAVEADVERLFVAAERLGTVTGLVNNAGVVAPASPVAGIDAARVERLLRTNVLGAFLCAAAAVRRMGRSHGGSGGAVVNVGSRAAVLGAAGEYVDYAASKAAVDALTVGLAREVAGDGIRVNAVRPGLIETDIHAPGRLDRLGPSVPLGRPGRPSEVAETIVWLLSPAASYVTGALVDIGGGR